jgi:GDP-4-dehydro-6-deoxy-D-mannose reductase
MPPSGLVTGAGGFVGRHLVASLREEGWRVTTLDRSGPADLQGDLNELPLEGRSYDVVFHLAGFSNPSRSIEAAQAAYRANAAGTARLFRLARAGRFILASSCQVYAPSRQPLREEAPLSPSTPYSASKLCGEALARASGKKLVVLRPFNHTGPGQSEAYVCPGVARQIALAEAGRGPREILVRDLSPRCDFFDVRDMVRAYRLAAERGRVGETYNVATAHPVSIARVVELLVGASPLPFRIRGHRGILHTLSGDSSKFRADTGWTPEIPLRKTLLDLLDYERLQVRSGAGRGLAHA